MHGRMHLEGLGLSTDVTAGILGTMVLLSVVGRLTGGLGDFLVPEKVLGYALLVEGAGVLAFLFAENPFLAYLSTTLLAVGFGAGYISLAVVLARIFWGRCFCPGARGQLPDCGNLAGHFPGTGWLDV